MGDPSIADTTVAAWPWDLAFRTDMLTVPATPTPPLPSPPILTIRIILQVIPTNRPLRRSPAFLAHTIGMVTGFRTQTVTPISSNISRLRNRTTILISSHTRSSSKTTRLLHRKGTADNPLVRNHTTSVWLLILLAGTGGAQTRRFGESLARDMLAGHNAVRARMGETPLTWSGRLATRAQDWADTLLARRQFVHQPNLHYGENLFKIIGASASPAQVVNEWAAESRDYDSNSNQCRGVCGHYTQIVWSDTKEVGCAVARGRGTEVWVCDYDPPGNWAGHRPY
jgi:pathogenesis-related protein 1